jgi:hypothetical protein
MSDTTPITGSPWTDRAILDDVAAGEAPFPLTELPSQPFAPRTAGKPKHIAWAFRLKTAGMETLKIGGKFHVTKSAYLRHLARTSGITPAPTRTVAVRRRSLDRAEADLQRAGI